MTGEMRFGEHCQPRYTAGRSKLVPRNLSEDMQIEIAYDAIKNGL